MKPADEQEHSKDQNRVAFWAERVCLLPEDIWDETDFATLLERLPEGMPFKDTGALLQATMRRFSELVDPTVSDALIPMDQRFTELERSMEEVFQSAFDEECACSLPLIGLLDDYLKATPAERALINFVLRRLANTTLERLLPRSHPGGSTTHKEIAS